MKSASSIFKFMSLGLLLVCISLVGFSQQSAPRIMINPLGHSGKINNILYTPDGKQIVSVSADKSIRVWNSESGELIDKFESEVGSGYQGMFYASAISPNGKYLAAAGYPVNSQEKNYIIIIDLKSGKQTKTAVGHTNVINSLDFDASGKYLASGSDDGTVKIWELNNSSEVKDIATIDVGSPVTVLTINQKTRDIAVGSDSEQILIYNTQGLENGRTSFGSRQLKKHKGAINKLRYSPDGKYLASSSFDNELMLWSPDGYYIREFSKVKNIVTAISFSYDSRFLVAMDAAGRGVSYSVSDGKPFTEFRGHDNTVFSADFSPASASGNYAVASAGGNDNVIHVWNPINGKSLKTIKGKGSTIWDLHFDRGNTLYISRKRPKDFNNPDYQVSFDFSTFGIKDKPGKPTKTFIPNAVKLFQNSEYELEFDRGATIANDPYEDGRILDYELTTKGEVIVASDFSLKMYDKGGRLLKEFRGHTSGVRAIALTKDGKFMATGSEDQTIRLWQINEKGSAPSMREVYEDPDWIEYFSTLEVDSITYKEGSESWKKVISYLKTTGDKTWKDIDKVFATLGETVKPFASLFVADDNEWVCWTPSGYFHCSSAGADYFGWHVNRGIRKLADFFTAQQYFEILYRPKILTKSIVQGRRVNEILIEEGERIFDLGKLSRPSAVFFNTASLSMGSDKKVIYQHGNFITNEPKLKLNVDVFDGGGGVMEVNIYQNQKLILNDKEISGFKGDQNTSKHYLVDLVNGKNEFKVVVKNFQKIESRPDVMSVLYKGEMIPTSNLYVMAVGINKYKNPKYTLNYAQSDAKSFVEKFTKNSTRIFKSVRKLEIYDSEATKENILKGFESIIVQAKPEDVFVFYYAGHGTLDEEDNDEYYFVPTNITQIYGDSEQLKAKGISATDMKGYLSRLKPQKQLILTDACHSGGAMKSMNVRAAASEEKAMVQLARASGVVMIASSGTQQFATEFDALKHGVFTYALLEALDGAASSKDNQLTVGRLKLYMEERVPELSEEYGGTAQYPTGFVNGNDFPIAIIGKKDE